MATSKRKTKPKRTKPKRTAKPKAKTNDFEPQFCAWLERVCKKEKPPSSVIAYNIGLFESTDGYSAYLIGADDFSEDESDWACDETFTPKERYFSLPSKEFKGTEWQTVVKTVSRAAKTFLTTPAAKSSFLKKAKAITVGFDDGDLVRVK